MEYNMYTPVTVIIPGNVVPTVVPSYWLVHTYGSRISGLLPVCLYCVEYSCTRYQVLLLVECKPEGLSNDTMFLPDDEKMHKSS